VGQGHRVEQVAQVHKRPAMVNGVWIHMKFKNESYNINVDVSLPADQSEQGKAVVDVKTLQASWKLPSFPYIN